MTLPVSPVPGYTRLLIEPHTPTIGAFVRDINLAHLGDETVRAELRKALTQFQVLFMRDQTLEPEALLELARVFGEPDATKSFVPRHALYPQIEILDTTGAEKRYGIDEWHADVTFSANPPTGTVLYAREVPSIGGDTLWASAAAAFDAIPEGLRPYLESLDAVHDFESSSWPRYLRALPDGDNQYRQARARNAPAVHPVVRTHPLSGRKVLFVNPSFTTHIEGLGRTESDALLTLLFGLFRRPELQARLRWQRDTVAVWDNRATVHCGVLDYPGQHRLMHRVTFGEDWAF